MKFYLLEGIFSKWRYRKISEIIREKEIILEIGCGSQASFLKFLSKNKDKKLFGIDPKLREDIDKLNNLTLIRDRVIDRINLPDNFVDCAIMLAVLEHLDKPGEVVSEIYRILKPGGLFCLTVPTPSAKKILEFLAFMRLVDPEHIAEHKNYFNRESLEKIVREAGFIKTKHQYFQMGFNNFFTTYK